MRLASSSRSQMAPLLMELLSQLLEQVPRDAQAGLREHALILLGVSSGRLVYPNLQALAQ